MRRTTSCRLPPPRRDSFDRPRGDVIFVREERLSVRPNFAAAALTGGGGNLGVLFSKLSVVSRTVARLVGAMLCWRLFAEPNKVRGTRSIP